LKYLLDSNIIIYHLNNDEIATKFISDKYKLSSISVITYYEVLAYGYSEEDRLSVGKFLDIFPVIDVDIKIIQNALQNLQKKKIKIADNLLASTAQINNLVLVTRNVADYSGIDVEILNIFKK
jgi:predicted nucleic acid-binding protein